MKNGWIKAVLIAAMLLTAAAIAYVAHLFVEEIRLEKRKAEYPVHYADLIEASAKAFSLDPYLVLSVMRCESSFDADAVSPRGARGLMQIMPDTGAWIAHKLDMDDTYTEEMLFTPAVNVRFGCWYLQFVSGRFDGRTMEMLAAYNAGHGTVEGWLTDGAYSANGALTVIPYESTALYYDRVIAAMQEYRALYPDLFSGDGEAIVETPAA